MREKVDNFKGRIKMPKLAASSSETIDSPNTAERKKDRPVSSIKKIFIYHVLIFRGPITVKLYIL